MLASGLGESDCNSLFTGMNLPEISNTTFKRNERKVGVVFEAVAKDSCEESLIEEKNLALKQDHIIPDK